jgi:hypothetical protein
MGSEGKRPAAGRAEAPITSPLVPPSVPESLLNAAPLNSLFSIFDRGLNFLTTGPVTAVIGRGTPLGSIR